MPALEIVISIGAIALIAWAFLRHNTKSGQRAVGAHVFLNALDEGLSRDEAQEKADAESARPGKTTIHRTYERLQSDYQGKAGKLIKAAEAKGFKS